MPTVEVVVARYNEDVEWCRNFLYPPVIYSKCEFDNVGLNIVPISIDDYGREASTWLLHIIKNYDQLSDFIIFLQARYNDHCSELLKKIRFDQQFTWLCDEMIENLGTDAYMSKTYGEVYQGLFPLSELPKQFSFGRGGLFMVSKEMIYNHPVEYYQTVLNYFRNSYPDKIWACYLERFWDKIFQKGTL
jgi:hypothetical protein